jgi:pimeloyl-ACP methyl ester carboxylesterase
LGAGALCRLVADYPDRFERVVFFLPAALEVPRPVVAKPRLSTLLAAVQANDPAAIAEAVAVEIPPAARNSPAAWAYLRERVEDLQRYGLSDALLSLPDQAPVIDRDQLRAVRVPALVLGCLGDDLHPAAVAEQLAAVLPQARLHLFDKPAVLWTNRAELRDQVAGFLNA